MEPNVYVVDVRSDNEAERTGLAKGKYAVWVFPATESDAGAAQLMFKPKGESWFRLFANLTQEQ